MTEVNIDYHFEGYDDQDAFLRDTNRYAAIIGGIGSGKTLVGAVKSLSKCVENPGVDGMVVGPDYNRVLDTIIPKYLEVFPKDFWKVLPHGNPPEAETVNGNHLFFRSASIPHNLRGPTIGFFHKDEAAYGPYESFQVLQGRLRQIENAQGWITTSPNKDNPLNWVYGEFAATDQENFKCYHLDTLRNPFIPESYKRDLMKQYSGDLQQIELHGLFIPIAGNCFFDTSVLRSMLEVDCMASLQVPSRLAPKKNGDFNTAKKFMFGDYQIYKPYGIGKRYVAGIDISEGLQAGDYTEGGTGNPDYQSLRIMDYNTGEDVARYHTRIPLDEFLVNAVELMHEYDDPYVGIEINYDRKAGQKIIDLGYPKKSVYCHKEGEYGWLTTLATRMPMLREYEEAIRSRSITMYSKDMVMEHLSFIRNKQGRPEAAYNAHDDEVISGAIAWQMRKHAKFNLGGDTRPTHTIRRNRQPRVRY